jgi:hypothetical protein
LVGFCLGLWGLFMLSVRHRSLRKKAANHTEEEVQPPSG